MKTTWDLPQSSKLPWDLSHINCDHYIVSRRQLITRPSQKVWMRRPTQVPSISPSWVRLSADRSNFHLLSTLYPQSTDEGLIRLLEPAGLIYHLSWSRRSICRTRPYIDASMRFMHCKVPKGTLRLRTPVKQRSCSPAVTNEMSS